MKIDSLTTHPRTIGLGVAAAAVLAAVLTRIQLPLLSNLRVSLAIFLILGMAMCSEGIGRVAAANQWAHPLAILGYMLGAAILVLSCVVFFKLRLPLISSDQQAFAIVAALTGAKIVNTLVHSLFSRG